MQVVLDQEVQDRAKAAADKLAAQKEEHRCRTEALASQIRLQHENHKAQLSALSAKHREQVYIHTPSPQYAATPKVACLTTMPKIQLPAQKPETHVVLEQPQAVQPSVCLQAPGCMECGLVVPW